MKYSLSVLGLAAVASADFTSIFNITATPDQVIASTGAPAPGEPGAKGQFNYAINSKTDTICYDITLTGVTGDYQSPARTATHIHEGAKGKAGPPRIAFPNPVAEGYSNVRRSVGCLTGPFVTGVKAADNVTDTGAGFTLAQIEANPSGFFTDSHTVKFVPGVVRGQLDQSFKIIDKHGDKYDDGSSITTATLTKTEEITISKCPTEVTNCPYATKPVVTKTEKVYTTVCPVSELPSYTKPAETHPVPTTKSVKQTQVTYPVETHPAPTKPAVTTYPAGTPVYPTTKPIDTVITVPVGTGTAAPAPVPTTPTEFTGAGSSNKVGIVVMAAGLAAALL